MSVFKPQMLTRKVDTVTYLGNDFCLRDAQEKFFFFFFLSFDNKRFRRSQERSEFMGEADQKFACECICMEFDAPMNNTISTVTV